MELVEYKVRPGNTLFAIAQFFDTTVADILKYNELSDSDVIFVDQILKIPAGSSPTQYYVVRQGDSLWSIAQRSNIPIDRLIEINGLSRPNMVYPGQIIKIQ